MTTHPTHPLEAAGRSAQNFERMNARDQRRADLLDTAKSAARVIGWTAAAVVIVTLALVLIGWQ